jgi:hypothetical protein
MAEQPPIKWFTWKKVTPLIVVALCVVSYRTYESYSQKGRVEGSDVLSALLALGTILALIAGFGWWANRPG